MSRAFPPLASLRAFEAAGRLMSFTKAADELHVTPAAISHQIKGLETHLGVALFQRTTRRLQLTDEGRVSLAYFREGFERLARGVEVLRRGSTQRALTISTSPSFAAKWLVPRLASFARACPGIDLRLTASTTLVDFHRDDVDAAIRFGGGSYEGLTAWKLFDEALTPMLSPKLTGRRKRVDPAALADLPLLHDDSMRRVGRQPGWRDWLRQAGVTGVDTGRGTHFDDGHLVLQAAAEGRGVALGRCVLARDDLAAGVLIAPFPLRLTLNIGYYLVVPDHRLDHPAIEQLRRWLLAESALPPIARTLRRPSRTPAG
ncbi:transcriptional regulator GcvA [Tahibacter amnicola]|uniref:Transcriptional regulator GcvA n=1 Tax=Tahibacter amnicola TaxID=2976241 RepID=A0ABY6BG45_9GAMM|nr:transcriptional regulator GcvA [Tahibacter amnicola]UXI68805.1 transcriptional regulator GcvA [Tahibacter amnicola]